MGSKINNSKLQFFRTVIACLFPTARAKNTKTVKSVAFFFKSENLKLQKKQRCAVPIWHLNNRAVPIQHPKSRAGTDTEPEQSCRVDKAPEQSCRADTEPEQSSRDDTALKQ